jgi:hypothetical protein
LKEPANSIAIRIGRYNGRTYWSYCQHTTRAIDCARKRIAVQVDSADREIRSI